MKKILIAISTLALTGSMAFAESLKLSTYYPAPSNVLAQMRLFPSPDLTGTCKVGTMFVNESGQLRFCRDDGSGHDNGVWGDPPGVWSSAGNDIFPTGTASNPDLRVGIGTHTPAANLHVKGKRLLFGGDNFMGSFSPDGHITQIQGKNPMLGITDERNGQSLWLTSGPDFGYVGLSSNKIGPGEALPLTFSTAYEERMRIRADGKIGINIGTNDPRSIFMVKDDTQEGLPTTIINLGTNMNMNNPASGWKNDHGLYISGKDFVGAVFNSDGAQNAFPATGLAMSENKETKAGIFYGGNKLGIKTLKPNIPLEFTTSKTNLRVKINDNTNETLYVYGAVKSTGGFFNVSDQRLKKNIQSIDSALSTVMKLRGVNFEWKSDQIDDMRFSKGENLGFLAQEVEEVIPEVVSNNKEGYKSVDYTKLVPLMLEAIKEQQKEIEELRRRLE